MARAFFRSNPRFSDLLTESFSIDFRSPEVGKLVLGGLGNSVLWPELPASGPPLEHSVIRDHDLAATGSAETLEYPLLRRIEILADAGNHNESTFLLEIPIEAKVGIEYHVLLLSHNLAFDSILSAGFDLYLAKPESDVGAFVADFAAKHGISEADFSLTFQAKLKVLSSLDALPPLFPDSYQARLASILVKAEACVPMRSLVGPIAAIPPEVIALLKNESCFKAVKTDYVVYAEREVRRDYGLAVPALPETAEAANAVLPNALPRGCDQVIRENYKIGTLHEIFETKLEPVESCSWVAKACVWLFACGMKQQRSWRKVSTAAWCRILYPSGTPSYRRDQLRVAMERAAMSAEVIGFVVANQPERAEAAIKSRFYSFFYDAPLNNCERFNFEVLKVEGYWSESRP